MFDWLVDIFSGGRGGQLRAEAERGQGIANEAGELALAERKKALKRAEFAAIPPLDKESTRVAGEAQMRKILQASGFRFNGAPLGGAPVGYSTLFGQ